MNIFFCLLSKTAFMENLSKLEGIKKLLIVKPSSLGDVIHALSVLKPLKGRFPDTEFHWVIAKGLETLLLNYNMVDRVWVINKDSWKKPHKIRNTIYEIRSLIRKLKDEEFDIAIDLQGLLRSGLITWASNAPIKVGFKNAREGSSFFYTQKVDTGRIHAVDRYLKVAQSLGASVDEACFSYPEFSHTKQTLSLSDNDYIVMVPGARWKSKQWPSENFGKLAASLNFKTIIVGSKDDRGVSREVLKHSDGKAHDLTGQTTLEELVILIKGAKFVVTNDTGPMHIAASLNIPVFAIFGPTDPALTGPYGKNTRVIRKTLVCQPCFRKQCKHLTCLRDLSFSHVYEIISNEKSFSSSIKTH